MDNVADRAQEISAETDESPQDDATAASADPEVLSEEGGGGESEISAGVGSTGAVDRTEEDFTRNEVSRRTGFMGKNSEITWIQRLKEETRIGSPTRESEENTYRQKTGGATPLFHEGDTGSPNPLSDNNEDFTVNQSSYHLDDFPIDAFEQVDPFELPTRELAEHLYSNYISRVHATFPLISLATFTAQFHKIISQPSSRPGNKWLAILNMIFAISAQYSHLVQEDWRGDDRSHIIFFTRARLLTGVESVLYEHPDLQVVQIFGLIGFVSHVDESSQPV